MCFPEVWAAAHTLRRVTSTEVRRQSHPMEGWELRDGGTGGRVGGYAAGTSEGGSNSESTWETAATNATGISATGSSVLQR